jgi:hypothetical protein
MLILQIRANINEKKMHYTKNTNNYVYLVYTDEMFRESIYKKIHLLKSQNPF